MTQTLGAPVTPWVPVGVSGHPAGTRTPAGRKGSGGPTGRRNKPAINRPRRSHRSDRTKSAISAGHHSFRYVCDRLGVASCRAEIVDGPVLAAWRLPGMPALCVPPRRTAGHPPRRPVGLRCARYCRDCRCGGFARVGRDESAWPRRGALPLWSWHVETSVKLEALLAAVAAEHGPCPIEMVSVDRGGALTVLAGHDDAAVTAAQEFFETGHRPTSLPWDHT